MLMRRRCSEHVWWGLGLGFGGLSSRRWPKTTGRNPYKVEARELEHHSLLALKVKYIGDPSTIHPKPMFQPAIYYKA